MAERNEMISEAQELVSLLKQDQLNYKLHFQLGLCYLVLGNLSAAHAELRTAKTLGYSRVESEMYLKNIYNQFGLSLDPGNPDIENENLQFFKRKLEHNQYYRVRSLADFATEIGFKKDYSVLDIGGGDGKLAFLLPNSDYCLAEPEINGISSLNVSFEDRSFDLVVSCHVLEHIEDAGKESFLDKLCNIARKDVVLLNPFHNEAVNSSNILKLVIDITNAGWAKEHLELGLPNIEMVTKYAAKNNYRCHVQANGTSSTSLAMQLLQHYAYKSGCAAEYEKISQLFNNDLFDTLDSEQYPTAYLIHLKL